MEAKIFAPESERYMVDHMNSDHADSNLMYAQVYGKLGQATAAHMVRLDREGMELNVTLPEGIQHVRILFDHPLQDEKDAERTLVHMSRQAQAILATQRA